jgi:hypothetical protein
MKISILLLLCITIRLFSQSSGPLFYKSGVMNGNNIKTVFGNWGVIGQPADVGPRGAWLKESNGYIGDISLVIGLELPIKDYTGDGKPDTIHSVITSPLSRPASQFDTDDWSGGGKPYTFMPVEGLANSSQMSVAMSDQPSTWPASWGNVWKGINGNGQTVADLEAYFQMDDQNDARFFSAANNPEGIQFRADTTNLTRKGQGIRVDVRYLQFKHPLFNDILFRVYDITNEGSYDYKKAVLGYVGGTLVGVSRGAILLNEYDDDYSILYRKEHTVITGDYEDNMTRNPFWQGRVGKVGEAFLSSEGNGAIGGYNYFTPPFEIPLGSDKELWKRLTPGFYQVPANIVNDTTVLNGTDGDYLFGSRYFSLSSKGMKRIVSAIAYDYTAPGIFQRIKLGKVLANNNFDLAKVLTQLPLPQFATAQTLNGTSPIQWLVNDAAGTVEICFSPDAGATWRTVADSLPDNGTYQFNTTVVPDCAFGILRIFFKGPGGAYSSVRQSGAYITINNAGNGHPFIKITSMFEDTTVVTEAFFPLRILAGDPDNTSLTASIYYSIGEEYIKSAEVTISSASAEGEMLLPLSQMPNGDRFRLKVELTDGTTTRSDSTERFKKLSARAAVASSNIAPVSGTAASRVTFGIVDKGQTTTDTYIISFTDTAASRPKTMSVFNKSKNTPVLTSVPLINYAETPVFDGVRIFVNDEKTRMDSSYWNSRDSIGQQGFMMPVELTGPNEQMVFGYPRPSDYRIIFGVKGRTIDLSPYTGFVTPQDSTEMIVVNNSTGEPTEFFFISNAPGWYDFYLVERILGKKRLTWYLALLPYQSSLRSPRSGDTITFVTKKGISVYDTVQLSNVALAVPPEHMIPHTYALHQNYPNPFNPSTTIEYSLAASGSVSLMVYDMLGRVVNTVEHTYRTAGAHSVVFDASNLSSGIYFYRLKSGGFTGTKKMLLLR